MLHSLTAKTGAQRQKKWRDDSKVEAGGTEVRGIFAHPDDHEGIKTYAAKLARKRAKTAAATNPAPARTARTPTAAPPAAA